MSLRHSVLWGPLPKAKRPRGRPASPPKPPLCKLCEFCKSAYAIASPFKRARSRRTCSMSCAAGLRWRKKAERHRAKTRAARAARFLSFPKEVVVDGE